MRAGSAALHLQVKKYSQLHDQRVQLRAPAQRNTAIYKDNLLLGLEAIVFSRSGESVEINTQCLDKARTQMSESSSQGNQYCYGLLCNIKFLLNR